MHKMIGCETFRTAENYGTVIKAQST